MKEGWKYTKITRGGGVQQQAVRKVDRSIATVKFKNKLFRRNRQVSCSSIDCQSTGKL
jgi:hypothetical protein